jgi:hypothetical protein
VATRCSVRSMGQSGSVRLGMEVLIYEDISWSKASTKLALLKIRDYLFYLGLDSFLHHILKYCLTDTWRNRNS